MQRTTIAGDTLVQHQTTEKFDVLHQLPVALLRCERKISFANSAAQHLLCAQSEDELLGRDLSRFVQAQDCERVDQVVHGGVNPAQCIARLTRLDGTELMTEISAKPVDEGAYVVIRQIAEEQHQTELVSLSEQKYRLLVGESLDIMLTTSMEGKILDINKAGAEELGFSRKLDVIGMNLVRDFCSDQKRRELLVQALKRQGEVKNFEYEIKRKDGSKRVVLETAIATFDGNGRCACIRSTLRDITEWKQLEQQLFQAQKMESMSALIGGIGHDFINVLNNLNGFAVQLRKYADEKIKVIKYADTIERSTKHGLDLAMQLMTFARQKKRLSSAQVGDVVAEIVGLAEETFPASITVEASVQHNLGSVAVDRGELYQALTNICINARDAMPGGGRLRIEASSYLPLNQENLVSSDEAMNDPCVLIRVIDSGSGIPDEIKNRIFDPFFTTKGKGKGTGLGLSIVYNIVKNYKGRIVVDSDSTSGTVFNIFLPLADAGKIGPEFDTHPELKLPGNELILLVDDEPVMQELGKELLEENGYRVLLARDGVEALEVYKRHADEVALVILDLLMPRLDGGQTYIKLKNINNKVKAFFCSGFTPEEVLGPLFSTESLKSLQKPFRPEDFIRTVRETLSNN